MIRKSGNRFSEKIMLKQKARTGCRSNNNASRSAAAPRGRTLGFLAMKERPMRPVHGILSIASLILGMASPALASDYDLQYVPVLRGSAPPPAPVYSVGPATFTRWSGFYVGGDFSFNNGTTNFSSATAPGVEFALQDSVVQQTFTPSQLSLLGNGAGSAFGGGAFLGYNTQWQDLVLGVEANYTHTSINTAASTPPTFQIARAFNPTSTGNVSSLSLSKAAGSLSLTDYGEARARAGYVVGNFLPYAFVGMVVGMGSYSISTHVDLVCTVGGFTGECAGYPLDPGSSQKNALLWGYSVGAGLDWKLTPNFFLRGEFDFDQFAPISNIQLNLVSGRLGGAFKF
jgi:outer membrane immunogenic protein